MPVREPSFPRDDRQSGLGACRHFGRSILHVVGSAVALPSTLASVFQPRPVSSLSYFTPFDSVETYSGCRIW